MREWSILRATARGAKRYMDKVFCPTMESGYGLILTEPGAASGHQHQLPHTHRYPVVRWTYLSLTPPPRRSGRPAAVHPVLPAPDGRHLLVVSHAGHAEPPGTESELPPADVPESAVCCPAPPCCPTGQPCNSLRRAARKATNGFLDHITSSWPSLESLTVTDATNATGMHTHTHTRWGGAAPLHSLHAAFNPGQLPDLRTLRLTGCSRLNLGSLDQCRNLVVLRLQMLERLTDAWLMRSFGQPFPLLEELGVNVAPTATASHSLAVLSALSGCPRLTDAGLSVAVAACPRLAKLCPCGLATRKCVRVVVKKGNTTEHKSWVAGCRGAGRRPRRWIRSEPTWRPRNGRRAPSSRISPPRTPVSRIAAGMSPSRLRRRRRPTAD